MPELAQKIATFSTSLCVTSYGVAHSFAESRAGDVAIKSGS